MVLIGKNDKTSRDSYFISTYAHHNYAACIHLQAINWFIHMLKFITQQRPAVPHTSTKHLVIFSLLVTSELATFTEIKHFILKCFFTCNILSDYTAVKLHLLYLSEKDKQY